jgi:3-hydroxyisobutyrate dehydrogenase-like beta-hydroxyacid dehydrogenase
MLSPISTVAFCGLGTMGLPMARNSLAAGFDVVGWNRTTQRAHALVEAGAEVASTPAAAADAADAVVVCVSDDAAVRAIAFDRDTGLVGALRPETLVIDCGTTSRELTAELDARVRERSAAFVDAPITGSKLGAEGGKLTFMVGGPKDEVERAAPLFAAMGKHTVHVGETVGLGQAAKYCLNMAQAVVLEGVLEAYVLARRMGVPLARMAEIFEQSAGKTGVGSFKTPYLLARDFAPHFRLDLMHKDLHLALDEAARMRVPLPTARTVLTIYDQGVAEGLGDRDFLVLAQLLERWSKTTLRGQEDA